jgi:hypothetical protein
MLPSTVRLLALTTKSLPGQAYLPGVSGINGIFGILALKNYLFPQQLLNTIVSSCDTDAHNHHFRIE